MEPCTPLRWNWHLDLLCEYLTQVAQGKCRRLIVNVPPRTMKSLLCTVFYPVWRWCTAPQRRFMCVSYSEELSADHSRYRRNVLTSGLYRYFWGETVKLAFGHNLKTQFENTRRGAMLATSILGSATGKGCDELIVDDPQSAQSALRDREREAANVNFDMAFRSRLNDPETGTILVIQQRLHESDLTGHLLEREPNGWTHLKLPAEAEAEETWTFPASGRVQTRQAGELLWPERFSASSLAGLKIALGAWAYAGQYQQSPGPVEGTLVKRDWMKYYQVLPAERGTWVQSWDCAFKASGTTDYVVGQVWVKVGSEFYLVDQVRARMDFVSTRHAIRQMSLKYPQAITKLIEDKANGPAVIASLRGEISGIVPVPTRDSKVGRLNSFTGMFQGGNVKLPEGTSWVGDFVEELTRFPMAAHDDQVDACTQALQYLSRSLGAVYRFYEEEAKRVM
ncbi:MAG TPA: phage terminase large subunit [Terriglobales bacterium]|nr:phage terminase large subunit [Terriglobales bacterium]